MNFIISKLDNEKKLNKHLPSSFFHKTTYKVAIGYSILVNLWIVPLMPTNYVLSAFNGDHIDANLVTVFISRLMDMEKH